MTKKKKVKTINLFKLKKCTFQKQECNQGKRAGQSSSFSLDWFVTHTDFTFLFIYKINLKLHIELLNPLTTISKPHLDSLDMAILLGPKVFLFINVFDMILVCDNCPSQLLKQFGISRLAPFF